MIYTGDKEFKSFLQLIAASEAGRDMIYFTFKTGTLHSDMMEIHHLVKSKTVGDLFKAVEEYEEHFSKTSEKFFSYLKSYRWD